MAKLQKPTATPANKKKVMEELTQALTEDGAPPAMIELWLIQGDMCYSAFLAGKMTAKRMCLEGDITEDRITEVAMEWAKLLVMKISYQPAPQQPPPSGLVIVKPQGPLNLN